MDEHKMITEDQYEVGTLEDADRFAIIRMAREAGLPIFNMFGKTPDKEALERFAALVAEATKEKAAYLRKEIPLIDSHSEEYENGFWDGLEAYEKAIRSME